MIPLLLVNLALIVFAFVFFKKKFSDTDTRSLLKHMGLLEVAWTGFLFTLGLFILFDTMEAAHNRKSFLEIVSKERIILLSLLFGFNGVVGTPLVPLAMIV